MPINYARVLLWIRQLTIVVASVVTAVHCGLEYLALEPYEPDAWKMFSGAGIILMAALLACGVNLADTATGTKVERLRVAFAGLALWGGSCWGRTTIVLTALLLTNGGLYHLGWGSFSQLYVRCSDPAKVECPRWIGTREPVDCRGQASVNLWHPLSSRDGARRRIRCLREDANLEVVLDKDESLATCPDVPRLPVTFLSRHDILAKEGRVAVNKDGLVVKHVAFETETPLPRGLYEAEPVLDYKTLPRKEFTADGENKEVRLDYEFSVSGLVADRSQTPIAGVLVKINSKTCRTGNDGEYQIDDLPMLRSYEVVAFADQPDGPFTATRPWHGTARNRDWQLNVIKNIPWGAQ
jgi:hypothetical protein